MAGCGESINGSNTNFCKDGLSFQISVDGVECVVEGMEEEAASPTSDAKPKRSSRDDRFMWADDSTKLFLSLYKEKKDLVATRKISTLKLMWVDISDEMRNAGYEVSPLQVENKFKTLGRSYNKMAFKRTARGITKCSYRRLNPLRLIPSTSSAPLWEEQQEVEDTAQTWDNDNAQRASLLRGQTGRSLAQCQRAIDDFTKELKEQGKRREVYQQEMLEQQRRVFELNAAFVKSAEEQRVITNKQREERNRLLRETLIVLKNNAQKPS